MAAAIIALIPAFTTTVVTATGTATVLTTAGTLLATALNASLAAGLSIASQALAPSTKTPIGSRSTDNLKEIARTNTLPARVIYGRSRVSGLLAYGQSVNGRGEEQANGRFLHMALALCEGPIAGVAEITMNDRSATDPVYQNRALFITMPGFSDQQAIQADLHLGIFGSDKPPLKRPAKWTGQHRLRGIAYIYGVLFHHPEIFPSGAPTIRCIVDGRLLYDPRDDEQSPFDEYTWQYTDNLALCVRDYLTNPRYGISVPESELDDFEDAADLVAA